MSAELVRAAFGYARRGLPVLPLWWTDNAGRCACGKPPGDACKPGKHPLGKLVHHGCKNATLDQRTIESWWRRYPLANVAIATGGAMRLLVVDVDPDTGGESNLADLEREHGTLPTTVESVTPRGGRHLYMLVPPGRPLPTISAGKLGSGIDTRCRGGLVAAPPSAVAGKSYAWSVDSAERFAEAPAWLLDLLGADTGGPGRATSPEVWRKLVEGIEAGARNHSIARLAGLLLRRLPDPLVAAQLVLAFNDARCHPPLPIEEVQRTLDSIASKEMRRRELQP